MGLHTFISVFLHLSWRNALLCLAGLILNIPLVFPQEVTLLGKVTDYATGKPLSSVAIQDMESYKGAITDTSGSFALTLTQGRHRISFTFLGYERKDTLLTLTSYTELEIALKPSFIPVDEVTIIASPRIDNVSSAVMSTITLTNREMMRLPSLLGEADPLKFLQLTPGVKSSTYGGVGFYVRGGGVDQNLILYDNTLLYNPGHLLGIFSVFNPEIIRDVSIIKAGIPAQYGGKLSSVIRLNSYKGNPDSLEFIGSTGLISSRVSVSGPLLRNRGSFILGARRTYLELLVKPIVQRSAGNTSFLTKDNNYNFYDFNAGAQIRLTSKDMLSFSGYFGKDKYLMDQAGLQQENFLEWGNNLINLHWDHRFNPRAGLSTRISSTKYKFNLSGSQADYMFGLKSYLEDYSLKSEFSVSLPRNTIITGLEITEHGFIPNRIRAEAGGFNLRFSQFSAMNALEAGLYINSEYTLSRRFLISAGIRMSMFNHHGPYQTFIRNNLDQITDTLNFSRWESLATYFHPEPRLVLKYQVDKSSSVKLSYMRMAQYIHLLTSSSASLPTDIWIPSTESLKPLLGEQFSLGYFRNIEWNSLEFSTEAYYKRMDNQLEFLRGIVNISIEGKLEDNIAVGYGRSYGVELYLARKTGKTTGWLSYTLSRTELKFDEINEGYFYPAKYDARHDVSLTISRNLSKKWNASLVFVYLSGNAFTMPVGRYIIQGNVVNQYGAVNSFRMPPNHRMDISLGRKIISRRGNESELVLSVYNIYNRANPYFIYYEVVGDIEKYTLEVKAFEVTLIPAIPSISWNFRF